ncbi:hypothetical protein [Flavobacterium urumqiense]|uniref:Uncharacterized protein n=1 Tax=Flavobacterium urumqiense TaxID=935224 RepID=A0A1H5RX84_9FLAO|nr:hypothetical protein [Flavobacterium urumqiense]SEF42976.1 hypothetical protein SAMN04488130_10164 [Flavobacterium urumqiense]
MRETKRISPMPDFKFRAKKTKESKPENELIHPRFEVKTTGSFGEKGSNSLLALMYSQENEILFI